MRKASWVGIGLEVGDATESTLNKTIKRQNLFENPPK
jgi:hypothetical protein